jgi:hypothetical protein
MTTDLKQEQKRLTECAAAALSRSWQASVLLADVTALSDENRRDLILRATALRDDLGKRWPEVQPLALYPALARQLAATSPTTRTRTRTELPGR